VILVAGIADEGPTARVIDALEGMGANYRVFDQRRAEDADIVLDIGDEISGGAIGGALRIGSESLPLREISAIYLRVMDDGLLPDVAALPPEAPLRQRCRRLHDLLLRFADVACARVLNRPSDMSSNHSKPYQAHAIRAVDFGIPETLITNDPAVAREFIELVWAESGRVIYKSLSGIRSIVREVTAHDIARLDHIRWCPTQFQRRVAGVDVRVHVIGHRTLAAAIASDAIDYRYAARDTGTPPIFECIELDMETHNRCIRLTERLRLPFAGLDLRRAPDGRFVCFEVNPSPAFSFYEAHTGLPIAHAVARYLTGETA
jgi:hypothetical protein